MTVLRSCRMEPDLVMGTAIVIILLRGLRAAT